MQSFIKYFRISVLLCCNLNSLKDKKGFRGYLSLIQTHFPPHSDHIRPSLLNVLLKCALKRQFSYFKFMLLLPFLVVLIKSSDKREMAVTVSANNWHNLCPHFEPTLSHHESGAKQSFNSDVIPGLTLVRLRSQFHVHCQEMQRKQTDSKFKLPASLKRIRYVDSRFKKLSLVHNPKAN